MTIIELKLSQAIKKEEADCKNKVEEIIDDTKMRIAVAIRENNMTYGDILKEGKLAELQSKLRGEFSKMNKNQAKSLDLAYELIEGLYIPPKRRSVGRPKNNKKIKEDTKQMKIDTFMDIDKK